MQSRVPSARDNSIWITPVGGGQAGADGTSTKSSGLAGTALKLFLYDGQGYWMMLKRLSQGRFAWWPPTVDARVPLSARELLIVLWNGDPQRAQMAHDWRRLV